MKFIALLGVLWRKLNGAGGKVRWEVDLSLWDPTVPNARQHPHAWRCEIVGPDGRGAVALASDGTEALLVAMATLEREARRRDL